MRIFFSVGEPSGDLHASNLIRRLKQLHPDLVAVGFGGQKMEQAGCKLLFDLTQLAVMFLGGAIKNLRTFFRLIGEADAYFAEHKVDAVVLIDYPGFNWWIARKAKKHGVRVFYYGVPQMWAWAPWRIAKIRKFVDHVICKLPFEPKWFHERGCEAYYVGHPYFDQLACKKIDQQFVESIRLSDDQVVLLLPGSRDQEVANNFDCLLRTATKIRRTLPNTRIVVGCYNDKHRESIQDRCDTARIETYVGRTQELMTVATVCVACSGSVSLELLYHRLPSVIVFKVKWWAIIVQAFLLRCKFISLPNLMYTKDIRRTRWRPYDPDEPGAEKVVMPEYLTSRDCSAEVSKRVARLLKDDGVCKEVVREMDKLAEGYATEGATSRAADYIIRNLKELASVQKQAA